MIIVSPWFQFHQPSQAGKSNNRLPAGTTQDDFEEGVHDYFKKLKWYEVVCYSVIPGGSYCSLANAKAHAFARFRHNGSAPSPAREE